MRLGLQVRGDLASIIQDETVETARGIRDGMDRAGKALQQDLRDQTTKALPKGRGIASAWRVRTYPTNPLQPTLRPSAVVWTRAPNIISAFEEGAPITVRRGKFLCWPTGFNATSGRRNAGARGGVRVTVAEMIAAKGQTVVIPSKQDRSVRLWCLRVRQASSTGGQSGRGRGRTRLFVGGRNVEVLTGRISAAARSERARELVSLGIVPMFYLKRTVMPPKLLDVAGAAKKADVTLGGFIEKGLGA